MRLSEHVRELRPHAEFEAIKIIAQAGLGGGVITIAYRMRGKPFGDSGMGNCLSGFSSFVWHQSLDAQISQGAECIDRTGWYAVMHTQRPAPMCFGIGRILLGLCAPCRPGLGPGPGPALNCGATGPQARRNVGNRPPLPTATSGGLLKQPDKPELARGRGFSVYSGKHSAPALRPK